MKIFAASLLIVILGNFTSAQSLCEYAYMDCDSVSIISVTFLDDEVNGDRLLFNIKTDHVNLYAPNFYICVFNESITFQDPNYGFFGIMGPTEVQLLYHFTEFNIPNLPELNGRIVNDNSSNEFPFCQMSFSDVINLPVPIINQDQETNIFLFPNPTKNEVTITTNDHSNPIKNVIFSDVMGKIILLRRNDSTFDLSGISEGIYIVEIELQNQIVMRKKILKLE